MAYIKTVTQDTYERVTNEVIKHLEKGEIVWKRGWNKLGLPKNIITGNTYRGWNVFWLNFATLIRNYSTPYFLTYKQATEAGGNVKKGEKGHLITYWAAVESKTRTVKTTDQVTGAEGEEPATVLVPKTFTVFNIDQTEGITFPQVAAIPKNEFEKIQACETVIEEMPKRPEIRYGGDRAYYVPSLDYVQLPPVERFKSNSSFYSVAFHELAHATGHQSRLNRKELVESDGFGKELYSKEELTAEFTAAFLSGICGIEQPLLENNAAYIQNWLSQLKNDKKLLLKAATQAQRAADFILNIQYVREEQRQEIAA